MCIETFPFHRCVSLPRALEAHNSGAEAALRSAARSPCGVAHTLVRRRRARAGRPIYTTHTRSAVGGGSQRAAAVQVWPAGFAAGASSKSGRGDLWACVARVGAARGDGEVCGPVGDLGGTSRHKGSTL